MIANNKFYKYAAVLSPLLLSFCTFKSEHKYINPIKTPPATISTSVDIQDPNFKDPFPLNFATTFHFKIDSLTKPIIGVEVTVDGDANLIFSSSVINTQIQFTLDPSYYKFLDGSHLVKIIVKVDTQSGSLANKLGGEYYTIEKDFTVIVDKVLPPSSGPIFFAMENGYLTIQWNKLSKTNFYYRINHYSYSLELGGDTVIIDPTITKYIDPGYVGGQVTYWVEIFNGSSFDPHYVGVAEFNVTPTNFKFSSENNFIETISWDSPVINDADTYVKFQGLYGSNEAELNAGKIVGDTIPFGNYDAVSVTIHRKKFPTYKYIFPGSPYFSYLYNRPPNFPSFSFFKSIAQPNFFIASKYGGIVRINSSTLSHEDSTSGHSVQFSDIAQFAISSDGNSGVLLEADLNMLLVFNPYDLSTFSKINFAPFDCKCGYISTGIIGTLSNNRLMGANYRYGYSNTVAAVADLNSNKVVWTDTLSNPRVDTPVISADGNYFAINNSSGTATNVFQNINGNWSLIGKTPPGKLFFRNNLTTELIVAGTGVKIYDVSLTADPGGYLIANRSFPITLSQNQTLGNIGYDEVTQNFYVEGLVLQPDQYFSKSTLKVYDVQTFFYKGDGVAITSGNIPQHFYAGGYHFVNSGFIEKIK